MRILKETEEYVRRELGGEGTGHDWWHVHRVRATAMTIAEHEKDADPFIVELGALLHDIADHKFHGGDEEIGPRTARQWLESVGADEQTIERVCAIIRQVVFKGAGVDTTPATLEGKIVQDADRLDALGAIGIGRAFAYGGKRDRLMYEPSQKPVNHDTFEAYKNDKGSTINHFYQKLLLLQGLMNTKTGKELARERHAYMEGFLDRFYKEWDGKL